MVVSGSPDGICVCVCMSTDENAATTLKDDGVILASVDSTIEKDLAARFDVSGYPTLKVFRDGTVKDYAGGRTEDTIVSYMRKITGPPVKHLETDEDVEAFKSSAKVVVVGFFESVDSDEYKALEKHAISDDDVLFGYTLSADVATASGASVPGIVLFKAFDEGKNVFDGEFSATEIGSFVGANSIPTVIPFSMEAVQQIFQSKIGKVAFLFSETSDEAHDLAFAAHAKEFKGTAVFSTADASNSRLTNYVGVKAEDFPIVMLLETPAGGQMKK